MAESKEESVICFTTDKEVDENDESLRISPQNYDFEGKVILECMLEENELPDKTKESTATGVSNQQYEVKGEDVVNDGNQCSQLDYQMASPNETNISTTERCYTETCNGKAYINKDGWNQSTKQMLCEICSTDNLPVPATHFCKTCEDPDPLCENCARHHLKEKLSRKHKISGNLKDFQKSKNESTKQILCEICSIDDLPVPATHFCKTCEDPDPLCEKCAKHHLKEKLSKNHEISENMKDFQKSKNESTKQILCEICSTDDLPVPATHFCKTCEDPDPLCKNCAKHHLKEKLSKNHEISGNMKDFQKSENESTKQILCEICSTDDLPVPATYFCKTCEDPDPLCENCAKHHLKEKLSKNHEICGNMKDFQNSKNESTKQILCEICTTDGLTVPATHFCKTCADPDPLCENCAKHHLKERLSKHHEICGNMKDFKTIKTKSEKQILCEICTTDDLPVPATHFCKTCEDPGPLCKNCARHHLKEKLSKHHEICEDIKDYQKRKNEYTKQTLCEICTTDDLPVPATHFCKTCESPDPLCENCAKHHLKERLSKNHETSGNIKDFQKRKNKSTKQILCEICTTDDLPVPATHFCKTCADPGPLCENCAKHHLKERLSKHHEICGDIKDIIKRKNESAKEILCKICTSDDLRVPATHLCKTCEDPDPLCEHCAKHHLKEKLSNHHEICEDIKDFLISATAENMVERNLMKADQKMPGKPCLQEVRSSSINLIWEKSAENVDHYQIRYKCLDTSAKWKFFETDSNQNYVTLSGLMANKEYIFQVRGIFGDIEGPYGPESKSIWTKKSLATDLLDVSRSFKNSNPQNLFLLQKKF